MIRTARVLVFAVLILGTVAGAATASSVTLQNATATYSQLTCGPGDPWLVGEAIDGIGAGSNGWAVAQSNCVTTSAETAWFETNLDAGLAGGTTLTFTLSQLLGSQHTLGVFRLSYTTDARVGGFAGAETWVEFTPTSASATNGAVLAINGNQVKAGGTSPDTSVYTITAQTLATGITGFRLETFLDGAYFSNGPGRQPTNGNFVLTEFEVDATATAVPEPGTLGLLLAGCGVLYAGRRRMRAR